MRVKFIYGILPAFIYYKELDQEIKNFARGWKIVIQPKYKCDEGILQHELEHVRQWYIGGFLIHRIRYKKSKKYRLKCEIKAYLRQMDYPKCDGSFLDLIDAAKKLTWDRYNLGWTFEEALDYLREKWWYYYET